MRKPTSEATDLEKESFSVVRQDKTEPLSECVRTALRYYFRNLDGHDVNDLYRLVNDEVERPLFASVLEYTGGNQTRAARILGISRSTLRKKVGLYQLDGSD